MCSAGAGIGAVKGLENPQRDSDGTTTRGTQNFWGRGGAAHNQGRHHRGVRRVNRLPFEAILDPKAFFPLLSTLMLWLGADPRGETCPIHHKPLILSFSLIILETK